MNSKKLITLLVLTTLTLSMVPVTMAATNLLDAALTFDNLDHATRTDSGEKGNDIEITSDGGAVASGYEVMLYWDKIQDWDGKKGHLNTTEPDDDGSIEIWFTVPEADVGEHTLWLTATDQENKRSEAFTVITDCDISTSSGLAGTKILVDLWGFDDNEDVAIVFAEDNDPTTWATPAVSGNEVVVTFTAADVTDDTKVWTNLQLRYYPVDPTLAQDFEIWHDDGTPEEIANFDGTLPWTTVVAGTFESAALDATKGLLDITVDTGVLAAGDTLYVVYNAYDDDSDVLNEDQDESANAEDKKYDGQTSNGVIIPGTFHLQFGAGGADIANDNGAHKLVDANGGDAYTVTDGSIDYVTGEWSIEFAAAPTAHDFYSDYEYVETIANYVDVLTTTVTDDLGSLEDRRVTIPSESGEGDFWIVGFDGDANDASDDFEIGAVITLSADEGDVGDKIEIDGEGFPATTELQCELKRGGKTWAAHIIGSKDTTGADDDETDVGGKFEFDIIVPDTDKKDDDFKIRVWTKTGTLYEAEASFEVTGLTSVSVDPDFGPWGSTVTVSGENFQNIKDKKVDITLTETDGTYVADIKTGVKVESDGSFDADVTVPTEDYASYKIKAAAVADDDGGFNIDDSEGFRIGTIMILISKDEAVVGDMVVLSGNGFTNSGEWNATFGDIAIFEEEHASATGLLTTDDGAPKFFVPQLEPGVYTILVWDVEAEIAVETDFTVTDYTVLDFELLEAPNDFSVDIEGWNWPEVDDDLNKEDEIEFVLFNETEDWKMDLDQLWDHDDDPDTDKVVRTDALLNATGFLNDAYWVVPDDKTLDKGTYTVNATIETTNNQEYFMQLEFVIGDVHLGISPRKATFRVGDTVSFDIEHTFGNDETNIVWGGDLKVYDPDDNLYWAGDELKTWSKVDTWYEVPYSAQTASDNPMVLLDDAPLGTWTYKWRENAKGDRDTIVEGTFNVEAGAEEVLVGQIEDINQAIDDLTDDITGVTDAIAGVQSNINSAIAAANAAVDAANAATEAVNAVAATAGDAATAAQNAAEAAADAKDAAGGLTTLVYGAIGASLVAALAAIVSLMQISRRIAG